MTKRNGKIIVFALLTWFFTHEVVIIADGLNDDKLNSEIAVIFGNKVNPDGSLSDRLAARLDKGIELYKDSIVSELFVSGGLGKEGYKEGDKMAEYLIVHGIPETVITIDNKGNTTHLTAQNFVKSHPSQQSVIVVSQYHHITRAKLAFRQEGVNNVSGAHCDYFEARDIYSCFREFFGYYKYLLFN
ncbi:MAG: vancomycin permeability regulator SanA [Flavobacteriaceae bacterium]|jgi:vancomycin permeability regulator SanA